MSSDGEFEMQAVASSQLAAVGYDSEAREMKIQFSNGSEYLYKEVPQEAFDELLSAPSVGQYFNRNVKWAYEYELL